MRDEKRPESPSGAEKINAAHRTAALEIIWRCLRCGELWYRETCTRPVHW